MGKQTFRQNAKKAREAEEVVNPAEVRDAFCCLPHCDEPGVKIECGHSLCGLDLLKLTKYAGQIERFTITCPMCRKLYIVDQHLIIEIMDKHLPFRCATFKCSCNTPSCKRCYNAVLRPCKSHGNYTCRVCCGGDWSGLDVKEMDTDQPTPQSGMPGSSPPEGPRRMPDFIFMEDWGMTDAQFEEVMRIYKASIGGMSALRERSYRLSRQCVPGIPSDFADDLEHIRRGDDAEETHLWKFMNAYAQVMLGFPPRAR